MKQVRAKQGDTIDSICHQYYGKTQGVTEQVISANPMIINNDSPFIAIGALINLPDEEAYITQSINLWD